MSPQCAQPAARNRGARERYHLGVAEFYCFTAERNRRAQELLRMAIRAEPEFAEPYTRLAYAITLEMVYFEGSVSQTRLDDALDLALQGLARDDRDPHSHFAPGRVWLARQEYDLAIDALDFDPYLALSHCGPGDSLAYEGASMNRSGIFSAPSTSAPMIRSAGRFIPAGRLRIFSATTPRPPPSPPPVPCRCPTPIIRPMPTFWPRWAILATAPGSRARAVRCCARIRAST